MGSKLIPLGVVLLVLGGAGLGCHRSAVQHKQPPDPLLITKKPITGGFLTSDPASPASLAPLPPPIPDEPGFPTSAEPAP